MPSEKVNIYEAEDFKTAKPVGMSEVGCLDAARIANAKLSSRRKIYIHPDFVDKPQREWACTPNPTKGYLVFVEIKPSTMRSKKFAGGP